MKSFLLFALVVGLSISAHAQGAGTPAAPEPGVQRVTLYSLNKHQNFDSAFLDFKAGALGRFGDLNYGSLYVNEDHDWFQVSTMKGVRTAFKDLGAHGWADSFSVPVVEPFPKLKEGEQRLVVVNADGADGKPAKSAARPGPPVNVEDGMWGAPIERPSVDSPGSSGQLWSLPRRPPPAAPRPRQDGVPKIDPIFTKAVVGHMYVIRVVDGDEDFYVLFRVESLVRGDNCTITWKRVPAPGAEAANRN